MKRYIIILAAAAACLASCDKYLSTTPESQMTAETYFKTAEDLQLFSNTFYNNLLDKEPWSKESDIFITANPSDLIRGGNDRESQLNSSSYWTFTNLRKMNTLLGNIDNCEDEEAVVTYTALVKFWRAYFYFEKVMQFGDVPWIDRELGSNDEELYAPRDTRETIMQHMLEDIDYAIENLPEKYAAPETAYRVNKYTAMALKAQFCLFEGTFRKYHTSPLPFDGSYTAADGSSKTYEEYLTLAANAAEQLMESKQYKLYSTGSPASDYVNLFKATDANTDEYILAINFDYDLKIKHDCGRFFTNQTASRPGLTKKIVDSYLMADGSRFTDIKGWQTMKFEDEVAGRDPRLAQTIRTMDYVWDASRILNGPELTYSGTGYQLIKFVPDYDTKPYSTDNCFNDMPVIRYAEVLLIYAEAKAEAGTLTQEDLDISVNLIRSRAGMPALNMAQANADPDPYMCSAETGFTNVEGSNKGVILEIRRERAIELVCEGYGRFYDLMRWAAGYCLNQPMYGMYIPGPGEYSWNDKGQYVFYIGTTTSKSTKYRIYDPEETADAAVTYTYLVDPESGSLATSGMLDVMHSISISFDESKHYLFPIPTKELQLPGVQLKQNPGWKE